MSSPDRDDGMGGGAGDAHDDHFSPLDFVIPDDISELDAEVRAYRREVRRARRREFRRHLLFTRRWRRYGLSGPLVVLILVLVSLIGSMMAFLAPQVSPRPPRRPLAVSAAAVGQPGGLLPDTTVTLNDDGALKSARDLRPGVLALVPANCNCQTTVDQIYRQAAEYRLMLYLVGQAGQKQALDQLNQQATSDGAMVAVDAVGELFSTYAARGLTLLPVRGDGVVTTVDRDVQPDSSYEAQFVALVDLSTRE
jgi:hypothetical protein